MATIQRKQALKLPGLPENPNKKLSKAEVLLKLEPSQEFQTLTINEVNILVGKGKQAINGLDLSSPQFQLNTTAWLKECPDSIKYLCLNSNQLTEFGADKSAGHLTKLKRLELANNSLQQVNLRGLVGLEMLNLANNRIEQLPDFTDQANLVYLDLSGNKITGGFPEFAKLKELRVLDLGECGLDLSASEFFTFLLQHLKRIPKLEYINFFGNPVQSNITEFRYFVIHELPKLKYLNWELISKEDRGFAAELDSKGSWQSKSKPVAPLVRKASEKFIQGPLRRKTIDENAPAFLSTTPTSESDPLSESTPLPRGIKQGTYVTSRLEALLAQGEAEASGNQAQLDELDKILDMHSSPIKPKGSGRPTLANKGRQNPALDELDKLLMESETPKNAPGDQTSYMDLLTDILQDETLLAGVKSNGMASSSSSSSLSKPAATQVSATKPKSNDPLSDLDELLKEAEMGHPTSAPAVKISPAPSNAADIGVQKAPLRGNSVPGTTSDPIDDLLDELDAQLGPNSTGGSKASPSRVNELKSSDSVRTQSTRIDDLESTIFDLVSEINTSNSSPVPTATSPVPFPSSKNSDLDMLEDEIKAMSSNRISALVPQPIPDTKLTDSGSSMTPSSSSEKISVLSKNPSAFDKSSMTPSSSSDQLASKLMSPLPRPPSIVSRQPLPVSKAPIVAAPSNVMYEPRPVGSALNSLANFTTNLTAGQLDSLLDSFDSASAAALATAPIVPVATPPAVASDSVGSNGSNSTPSVTRSMQRGPRPSVVTPPVPAKVVDPLDIPVEELVYDFMLGKGTWGDTYEGTWRTESSSNVTTMKKLSNMDFSTEAVASFRKEVKDLMQLKHPNLIPILGCSIKDAKVIVYKGVSGVSLHGYLKNPSNIVTPKNVLGWARQLASVIQYLHAQNVIHGGIKTTNIMIDKDHHIWVKDYGFMDEKDKIPLEQAEPRHFAPELISSREGYNETIDTYAFGLVLYEMVAREVPFSRMKTKDIIEIIAHRPLRPETVPAIFPPVFVRLLQACWSHDPQNRPAMEKVAKILLADEESLLGEYASLELDVGGGTLATKASPMISSSSRAPRPSEPVKPANLSSPAQPRITPNRPPAASMGVLEEYNPNPVAPKATLRVYKPSAIKAPPIEDVSLDVEQERKLVSLLSKLQDMLASGEPDQQMKALATLTEVVKDEKRINYVATRSYIMRDLVELLRANSVDTITSWQFDYPLAYETIETIVKTVATLSSTDQMACAFVKHNMMVPLAEFMQRGPDTLKIVAAQAAGELCLTPEGRIALKKAAGLTSLLQMLKTKNDFVIAQAAWTLSSFLDDEINQDDFVMAGGLSILTELLNKTNNAAIRLRVLDALANFWNNEKAREAVEGSQLKDKFLVMLSSPAYMLKSTAIRGLAKFTRYLSFVPSEVEALKIIKATMEVVQSKEALIRDRLNAIRVCDNLTRDKSSMANFRDVGGLSMMVKLLSDSHPDIRMSAIHIIQRAISDERSRDAVTALGGIAPLVAQLASGDAKVRMRAMQAVDVLRNYPKGRQAIIANAGVSRVVSIVAFSTEAAEQVLALQLLDIFSEDPESRESVREAGGITAILEGMQHFTPEGKFYACLNLGDLCSTERNRQALVEQKGLISYLTSVTSIYRVAAHSHAEKTNGEPFVPEEKLIKLVSLCMNMIFNLSEVADYRAALRDCDAAQFACEMFASPAEILQHHALRALSGLAKDPKNRVYIRTGAAKRLKIVAMNETNQALAKMANQVQVLIDTAN